MRYTWISTVAVASLCAVSLTVTPTLAAANQSVDRNSTVSARSTTVAKNKPGTTKPASTTVVSATTTAKQKERAGKRFWARIMDSFREIHSAEKKQSSN